MSLQKSAASNSVTHTELKGQPIEKPAASASVSHTDYKSGSQGQPIVKPLASASHTEVDYKAGKHNNKNGRSVNNTLKKYSADAKVLTEFLSNPSHNINHGKDNQELSI